MRSCSAAPLTILLLALAGTFPGCRRNESPPPPAPTSTLAPDVTASVAIPQPPPASSVPADASAERSPATGTSTGTVRCGDGKCQAVARTCCEYGDVAGCIASVPPGPHDQGQPLAAQIQACDAQIQHRFAMERIRRCDDSSDCAAREMCCEMWLYSGAARFVCEALTSGGKNVCDYGEACVDDVPCRTTGTQCIDGRCRKTSPRLRCGSAVCSAGQPACCGDPEQPTCRPRAQCVEQHWRYECSRPEDCPPGEHCQAGIMGTTCQGMLDGAHLVLVCNDDADCVEPCAEPGKQQRCESGAWFKTCQCR